MAPEGSHCRADINNLHASWTISMIEGRSRGASFFTNGGPAVIDTNTYFPPLQQINVTEFLRDVDVIFSMFISLMLAEGGIESQGQFRKAKSRRYLSVARPIIRGRS